MKTLLTWALAALTVIAMSTVSPAAAADSTNPDKAAAEKKGRGKLVHMVAFKFKDTAGSEGIRKVEEAFAALPAKIPQIATFETGTNVSPEKLDKGFTHAFLLTFHSAKDRDDYLVHPAHKEFGGQIGPYLADVFVIDFWSKKEKKAEKKVKKEK